MNNCISPAILLNYVCPSDLCGSSDRRDSSSDPPLPLLPSVSDPNGTHCLPSSWTLGHPNHWQPLYTLLPRPAPHRPRGRHGDRHGGATGKEVRRGVLQVCRFHQWLGYSWTWHEESYSAERVQVLSPCQPRQHSGGPVQRVLSRQYHCLQVSVD